MDVASFDWHTTFFSLPSMLGAPVWLAYTRHCERLMFSIGHCCHSDREHGLGHALGEALHGRLFAWLSRNRNDRTVRVESFLDHVSYYCKPDRIDLVDEFFSATEPTWQPDLSGTQNPAVEGAIRVLLGDGLAHGPSVVRVLHPRWQMTQMTESRHDAARSWDVRATTPSSTTS